MNKRLALAINVLAIVLSVIGTFVCAIMFAMAVRFMELGRCVFYFIIAALCIETAFFSITNLLKKRK
jgi:hypothetical protein